MKRQKQVEQRAYFSLLKASEGGRSFRDAAEDLSAAGVERVRRAGSIYVGHYGLSVPQRFQARAARILFGD